MKSPDTLQRRRLKTFGVFSPAVCTGRELTDTALRDIYQKLKSMGFKETCWQFIFEGQRAGLVLPYNDGKNEVHIRFYDDRVFAEFEVGRASLAHFLGPFLNANSFILETLKNAVSRESYAVLCDFTHSDRLLVEERLLDIWDHTLTQLDATSNHSERPRKRFLLRFASANALSNILSWRRLTFISGAATAFAISLLAGLQPGFIVLSIFMLASTVLPKVGQP